MADSLDRLRIAAVSGSQRAGSVNTGLLRALVSLAERRGKIDITIVDGLADLPFASVDAAYGDVPDAVRHVHDQITKADGIIIATPEYCYSVPALLKNFFDWQTLPVPPKNTLRHKPLGIVGASISMMGTNRAQMDLRKIALYSDLEVMGRPEVYVDDAAEKFTKDGELTDQATFELLERWLDDFEEFARSTLRRGLPDLSREYLTT
ncbi:NAD(P)H-dependent oxidoreductase [Microbacterium sp. LWS13-1.2]|uniref:NAD(P)H-dependent oxidoreductase n=1 Tax=Microbacterium sp. LWS13-1.2 TaxID=3135264 RepID=A0AAU6SBI9_9MICO